MKFFALIALSALILAKVVLGSIFVYQVKADPLLLEKQAVASDLPENPANTTADPGTTEGKKDVDLDYLLKKQTELQQQEEELAQKKQELMAIQEEINKKIEELTQLRNEIREQMNQKKTMEEAKLRHLIKAYSTMKPQKAATLIEKLDIDFAIELLSKMKGDSVGSILTFVEVGKAAKISEGLAKR
jgi:flagellar motility protein MotE (MotC chaperone)